MDIYRASSNTVVFVSEIISNEPLEIRRQADNKESGEIDIMPSSFVRKLSGREYLLSSGVSSNVYYETLEAAFTYPAVSTAVNDSFEYLNNSELLVGIGFGGIYLASYASFATGIPCVYIFPNCVNSFDVDYQTSLTEITFLDDFVSTGRSYFKAVKGLSKNSKKNKLYSLFSLNTSNNIEFEHRVFELI